MLNFEIYFVSSKIVRMFASLNKKKNEIYYLPYVLYDAGNFRREPYCIILNS